MGDVNSGIFGVFVEDSSVCDGIFLDYLLALIGEHGEDQPDNLGEQIQSVRSNVGA